MIIGTTHVWRINGQLIVADTIEKAIEVFKNEYEYPANEVDKIERVYNDGHLKTSGAYVEIKPDLKDNRKPVPDCMVDVNSMVDGFSDVKRDTITLVGDGAKGEIRDACTEDYTPFKDIPIIQTNLWDEHIKAQEENGDNTNESKTDLE